VWKVAPTWGWKFLRTVFGRNVDSKNRSQGLKDLLHCCRASSLRNTFSGTTTSSSSTTSASAGCRCRLIRVGIAWFHMPTTQYMCVHTLVRMYVCTYICTYIRTYACRNVRCVFRVILVCITCIQLPTTQYAHKLVHIHMYLCTKNGMFSGWSWFVSYLHANNTICAYIGICLVCCLDWHRFVSYSNDAYIVYMLCIHEYMYGLFIDWRGLVSYET
jgi:hypothetical protein